MCQATILAYFYREGLEVVEKFISSEHLLIFSAMMRLEYDKRCSSADPVNLGSMCYAKNPSECLDEVCIILYSI